MGQWKREEDSPSAIWGFRKLKAQEKKEGGAL